MKYKKMHLFPIDGMMVENVDRRSDHFHVCTLDAQQQPPKIQTWSPSVVTYQQVAHTELVMV